MLQKEESQPTTPTPPDEFSTPTESPTDDLDLLTDTLASASKQQFEAFIDGLTKLNEATT